MHGNQYDSPPHQKCYIHVHDVTEEICVDVLYVSVQTLVSLVFSY